MRFLLAPEYYDEMLECTDHTPDCYVRPGEYLHHLYKDGVKYVVAQAMSQCLQDAHAKHDLEAIRHLELHQSHYDRLANETMQNGNHFEDLPMLGDPPPPEEEERPRRTHYHPPLPTTVSETGLSTSFLFETVYRHLQPRAFDRHGNRQRDCDSITLCSRRSCRRCASNG